MIDFTNFNCMLGFTTGLVLHKTGLYTNIYVILGVLVFFICLVIFEEKVINKK